MCFNTEIMQWITTACINKSSIFYFIHGFLSFLPSFPLTEYKTRFIYLRRTSLRVEQRERMLLALQTPSTAGWKRMFASVCLFCRGLIDERSHVKSAFNDKPIKVFWSPLLHGIIIKRAVLH